MFFTEVFQFLIAVRVCMVVEFVAKEIASIFKKPISFNQHSFRTININNSVKATRRTRRNSI